MERTAYFISACGRSALRIQNGLIYKVTIEKNTTGAGDIIDAEASLKISKGGQQDLQRIAATHISCGQAQFVQHLLKLIGAGQTELSNQLQEVFS